MIDACPECRGVWLDRGELDKILAKERAASAADPDQDFFDEVEGRRRGERGEREEDYEYGGKTEAPPARPARGPARLTDRRLVGPCPVRDAHDPSRHRSRHGEEEGMARPERRYGPAGGLTLGGIMVLVGVILIFIWSFWIGLIVALIGL